MPKKNASFVAPADPAVAYRHPKAQAVQRPDVGLQQEFTGDAHPPRTYRYDSSLDPALSWDENADRELVEWLIDLIRRCADDGEKVVFVEPQAWRGGRVQVSSLKDAAARLKALSSPFLNWTGKAERHQISIPTLPLFVHERHSTVAIIEGLRSHRAKGTTLSLFGDPQLDLTERLAAYEHKGPWTNRMILGDSLVIMNSLLEYEGLGGQVQMIYIDPPYGVKFGSNFQPFVRKRDVKHGGDADMTREPEMVKAYRDTWELGLHSYLSYLRDRIFLARELLNEAGSIFVQISDENLHHVRQLLDEVMGATNFVAIITYAKTTSTTSDDLSVVNDYILWYVRNNESSPKKRLLFKRKRAGEVGGTGYNKVQMPDGSLVPIAELGSDIPSNARICATGDLTSSKPPGNFPVKFQGKIWRPTKGYWKTGEAGMERLLRAGRVTAGKTTLGYIRYLDDFPFFELNNIWTDTVGQNQFGPGGKVYAVQTANIAIQRCMLMCTEPGDLVLDPTCGSGTTAYVAEEWGRRWITIDTSRVPLALARQRLLTATFQYYELKDPQTGPMGGFVYKRRQNKKGEELGGLVPHVTLGSITKDEEPATEVLVDRPEEVSGVIRVSGPFAVEAIMPAATDVTTPAANEEDVRKVAESRAAYRTQDDPATHIDRMLHVLRQSKTLRLAGNRMLSFASVTTIADTDWLHAEAVERPERVGEGAKGDRVAVVFGPEHGAIGSDTVYHAAEEAKDRGFAKLYFFGFAIDANARQMVEDRSKKRLPCVYVAITPDVVMSDLLKTTRSSEIFSITGLPDIEVDSTGKKSAPGDPLWRVKIKGLDTFNPATLKTESEGGENLPCWMLDTDYDGLCFHASQVFFPKTSAWDALQKSLRATFDESVWSHLSGTESEPFALGKHRRIAVKVIDDRGNELSVVKEVRR